MKEKRTVVIRRTKEGLEKRTSVTKDDLAKAIVNSVLQGQGLPVIKDKPKQEKPKPCFDLALYERPLTRPMFQGLDRYFIGLGLEPMYSRKDFAYCKDCNSRQTFKVYYGLGQCKDCNSFNLGIGSFDLAYYTFPCQYRRFVLDTRTSLVKYQVEVCQGRWNKGWKTKIEGLASRNLKA